jgi:hypothetical protein
MKWLVCSKTFVIHTSLNAEQTAKLIDDAVAPEQTYWQWHKDALPSVTLMRDFLPEHMSVMPSCQRSFAVKLLRMTQ